MALEVKQLDCPSCGASLEVKNALRAKSIVCQSCGSQIDLTDPQYGILGRTLVNSAPPRTPITIGMSAEFDGEKYTVIGRVRYREDSWMWDEWLLMTDEGRFKWLTEGEEDITLYDTIVPTNPVDPSQISEGDTVNLEGTIDAEVEGKGQGRLDYIEGELTWKATVGDQVGYIDADFPDESGNYSIEWTEGEVEFFKGKKVTANEVRRAFGLPELAATKGAFSSKIWVTMVVIMIVLCLCAFMAAAAGGDSTTSDDGEVNAEGTPIVSSSGGSGISGWFGGITFGSSRSSSTGGRSSGGGGSSGSGGK